MAKNKNRNRNKYQSPGLFGNNTPREKVVTGSLPLPPVKEEPKLTVEDVAKAESREAFEANRSKLIKEWEEEAKLYQQMADDAKKEYERINQDKEAADHNLQQAEDDLASKRETLRQLSEEVEKAKKEAAEVEGKAKEIVDQAEKKASDMVNSASVDAARKRTAAQAEAQEAFVEVETQLKMREEALENEKKQLEDGKRKLKSAQTLFDMQKMDLDETKEQLEQQKELYSKANPKRLESLERSIGEQEERYEQLKSEYQELRSRHIALETKMDSIRAEVDDPESGRTEYALRDLLDEIRELKENLAKKTALLDKYPSDGDIQRLEIKADSADKLEEELRKTAHQRDDYKQRYEAEHNLTGELSATKRELDATRALNEHLLQELEKNKTALENRTGNVCPSLTRVDEEVDGDDFKSKIERQRTRPAIKKLDELIDAIYDYAGNGNAKEKLYYEKDDLRSFLAGMAVSRLIILKGMSGTGKSSMPRIISKAISANHSLIPVESSWRDRNELLGYYNDFNKLFNAKSFTIELYRSGKTTDIPSFIVLDEMNLARIEYYFSDFLAKLEEPKEKWQVELVSSDMRTLPFELPEQVEAELRKTANKTAYELWNRKKQLRNGNTKVTPLSAEEEGILRSQLIKMNALMGAHDLIDGRKLQIPQNVWFIGTANEDESTFEISDKVYDRAQVIVLDKKGKPDPAGYRRDVTEQFISADALQDLFGIAIKQFRDAKKEKIVEDRLEEIDRVLMEKFSISFGNRIVTQAIEFAAVFTAAGGELDKALDYQISTKILRKVYNSDDLSAFESLLNACKRYDTTSEAILRRMDRLSR